MGPLFLEDGLDFIYLQLSQTKEGYNKLVNQFIATKIYYMK